MIKIFIIVVVFVTGRQCKAISAEVAVNQSEERTADISDNAASKTVESENTQENTAERTAEDSKTVDPENIGERYVRSTEESRVANDDVRKPTTKTSINEPRKATNSETSEPSSKTDSSESTSDKSSRSSRNSEEHFSEVRLDTHESKSIETETAERDDASHINNKESKQASGSEGKEAPMDRISSENNSKSVSIENEDSKSASGESINAVEAAQLRTANREEHIQSSLDANEDYSRSDTVTDIGIEALVRSEIAALADPPIAARRMLGGNSNLRYVTAGTPDSPADTRMAPEEYTPSEQPVHSNYFGSSRSSQSQYPYSPLDSSKSLSFLPFSFSKDTPSAPLQLSKLLPPISSGDNLFTQPKNSNEDSRHVKPPSPLMDPNKLLSILPPLPPLDRMFKPQPPLPLLDPSKPFRPPPPLPHLEPMGQFRSLPPLPPLKPFGPFRSQTPHFDPIGLFKTQQPFPTMDRHPMPDPSSLWKPTCIGCENLPIQNWQPQQSIANLFSNLPQQSHSMTNLPQFKSIPNLFATLRQGAPEESPQMSASFTSSWDSFDPMPMTVRSAYSYQSSQ